MVFPALAGFVARGAVGRISGRLVTSGVKRGAPIPNGGQPPNQGDPPDRGGDLGETTSNSKAYDLLDTAGLVVDFGNELGKEPNRNDVGFLCGYLQDMLVERSVRFLCENTKGETPYSVVKKVYEVTPKGVIDA